MPVRSVSWILLPCLAAAAALQAAAPADPRGPYAGAWHIIESEPARLPGDATDAVPDAALLGSRIAFLPDRVDGTGVFGCANAQYEIVTPPAAGLFQGAYGEDPEAERRAAALHLSPEATPTLRVGCDTGSFDFHQTEPGMDPDRLLIMLDRVIYTLQRD